jgi:hypothetical protein
MMMTIVQVLLYQGQVVLYQVVRVAGRQLYQFA